MPPSGVGANPEKAIPTPIPAESGPDVIPTVRVEAIPGTRALDPAAEPPSAAAGRGAAHGVRPGPVRSPDHPLPGWCPYEMRTARRRRFGTGSARISLEGPGVSRGDAEENPARWAWPTIASLASVRDAGAARAFGQDFVLFFSAALQPVASLREIRVFTALTSRATRGGEAAPQPGPAPPVSTRSRARAYRHIRSAVAGETPRASAATGRAVTAWRRRPLAPASPTAAPIRPARPRPGRRVWRAAPRPGPAAAGSRSAGGGSRG